DVEEMLRDLKGYRLFEGYRGEPPRDKKALVDIVVRVSRLIAEHEEITEVDLNPVVVFAEGQGAKVVDARFVVR
ncbi:MAG: acetate--CoA ligase family protein, partial [Thermofilum sp.]